MQQKALAWTSAPAEHYIAALGLLFWDPLRWQGIEGLSSSVKLRIQWSSMQVCADEVYCISLYNIIYQMMQCASCVPAELQLGSRRDRWLDACRQVFFVWNALRERSQVICTSSHFLVQSASLLLSCLSCTAVISVYNSNRTSDNFIWIWNLSISSRHENLHARVCGLLQAWCSASEAAWIAGCTYGNLPSLDIFTSLVPGPRTVSYYISL